MSTKTAQQRRRELAKAIRLVRHEVDDEYELLYIAGQIPDLELIDLGTSLGLRPSLAEKALRLIAIHGHRQALEDFT